MDPWHGLRLRESMVSVHDEFHVSALGGCLPDSSLLVAVEAVPVQEDLACVEAA